MLVRIAFCDDDVSVLEDLRRHLDKYCRYRRKSLHPSYFHSPLDLVAQMEKGDRYDILFLDVLMPGQNGMELAAEIRGFDQNIRIVFLTNSMEYAVESYRVRAFFYQLKPIREQIFFGIMDAFFGEYETRNSSGLVIQCKTGLTRILISQLEYCEVVQHTLFFHLVNGAVLESVGSMNELMERVVFFRSVYRCHRSYIVNLDYVQSITYKYITMSSGAEIPIPRGKYHEAKDAYLKYAFQSGQVII